MTFPGHRPPCQSLGIFTGNGLWELGRPDRLVIIGAEQWTRHGLFWVEPVRSHRSSRGLPSAAEEAGLCLYKTL